MALIGQYRDVGTGDTRGQFAGHFRRRSRVKFARGDQRRCANIAQILGAVHILSGEQLVRGQVTLRIVAGQVVSNGRNLRRAGCLIFTAEPA